MRIIISIVLCFVLTGLYAGSELDSLISDLQKFEAGLGIPGIKPSEGENHKFPIPSDSVFKSEEENYKGFYQRLRTIPTESLSRQEMIDRSVLELKLQNNLSYYRYRMYYIPFNAEGGFYNHPVFMIRNYRIEKAEDAQLYLNWLNKYMDYLGKYKEYIKEGMEAGVKAPEVIIGNTIQLLEPFCNEDVLENPLYLPFKTISQNLDDKEIRHFSTLSVTFFKDVLIPGYRELRRFMEEEYLPLAYKNPGIYEIPDGKEYYADRVRHYTTLDLSPEEVHQKGLEEVKRILSRMQDCLEMSGFDGNLDEFIQYLRTHPRFYAPRPEDLLYYASWLSKKAEGQLPAYFKDLPSLPFTVEPVPESIAPTYTSGRYVHGSWESKKPGIYWVNTFKLQSRPLYNMPALTLHEAVPGHHLQNQFIAEQDEVSNLRRQYYISAFGEGWGLYSEYLGEEMGMYEDAYELFGRLSYEMWRACRLVVDTGIHFKGWSREKAVEYLQKHTALSVHEVNTEIDRYIGWPGQALSYKIGEIKIRELREKAESQLGDKFDIRDFHYEILKNGSVPLSVLEAEIEDYINKTKG